MSDIMADPETTALIESLKGGDPDALAALFSLYRDQLRRIVTRRIDRRLAARVDASDVVQQSYLAAQIRLQHYVKQTSLPFSIWIRQITLQTLVDVHRRHLGARMRSAGKEVSLERADSSFVALAELLVANIATPSEIVDRAERHAGLRNAIDTMDEIDREILVLRHFEELGNKEVAERLGIGQSTASNRYVRALKRLGDVLTSNSDSMARNIVPPDERDAT